MNDEAQSNSPQTQHRCVRRRATQCGQSARDEKVWSRIRTTRKSWIKGHRTCHSSGEHPLVKMRNRSTRRLEIRDVHFAHWLYDANKKQTALLCSRPCSRMLRPGVLPLCVHRVTYYNQSYSNTLCPTLLLRGVFLDLENSLWWVFLGRERSPGLCQTIAVLDSASLRYLLPCPRGVKGGPNPKTLNPKTLNPTMGGRGRGHLAFNFLFSYQ